MTIQCLTENSEPLPEPSILYQSAGTARTRSAPDRIFSDCVSAGITGIILRPNARITGADGARMRAEFLALTGGKRGCVLLQITGVGSVSREAISIDGGAANFTALAVLGSTPVDRVIAHRFIALCPAAPPNTSRMKKRAIIWLQAIGRSTAHTRSGRG